MNEFENWHLRCMVSEIDAYWEEEKDIHPIDRDVQMQFRQGLIDALAERSAKSE